MDELSRHEALDRTYLALEIISAHLLDHPFLQSRPELKTAVQDAVDKLAYVYKVIGIEYQ